MKLSIVIPFFRKAHILERCLRSIETMSLKDYEVILVLDGPSDEARDIADKVFGETSIAWRVIEIEHGGACKARNAGYAVSTGEYLLFLDADIVLEPEAAKNWVEILDRDQEYAFIYSAYKFLNERGYLPSEPFDPWLLRIRNYISGCFPVRRKFLTDKPWNESLKSLQDWDFWLGVVERGGVGKFQSQGFAWATEMSQDGISGVNCKPEVWLDRVDAVRKAHDLPERETCVCSMSYKPDAIALAKFIDADFQTFPNFMPNRYKNVIQIGFSLKPESAEDCAANFSPQTKNYLFWAPDNIYEAWNEMSFNALQKYSLLMNRVCKLQFVEDKTAKDLMTKAGFNVEVLPMPMRNELEVKPLPEQPRWAVDCGSDYGKIFALLEKSAPDMQIEPLMGAHDINEYTGLIHYFNDKTLSNGIKRMLLTGRHVISNVRDPHAGYFEERNPEKFVTDFVDHIRKVSKKPINKNARDYYVKELGKEKLMEVLCK